jgi:hypothetical protein
MISTTVNRPADRIQWTGGRRLGEPESEIGFFACNHQPVIGIIHRASTIGERLGADPDRAMRWAAV